jgi:2-methylcitrate dehydratase PrpD
MVDAFSFTLCQTMCSSELMNSGDSVMRSVREAFMARSAVSSSLIAKKNMKGFDAPFEGKMGFYHAFIRDEVDLGRVTEGLGKVWQAKDLCFKLWPSCLGTHSCIDAMLQLVREHGIKPQEIEEVHVTVSSVNQMLLEPSDSRKAPESVINAKFSIPYTSAVAAVRRRVTLEDFDDASLHDPLIRSVASKFTYDLNEEWAPAGRQLNSQMTIKTPRGTFYREVTWPYGHVNNPCTDDELGQKIYACAKYSRVPLSEDRIRELVETVSRLEELDDIRELTALL